MFKWYDLDEGKLTLNFSGVTSKLNLQIGIYADFKDNTDYMEHIYPMLSISDGRNYAMALNPSNSLMLASIMSVYIEEGTIKEYFNKTDLSNGWYVAPKYADKHIFKKVLTNDITLKIKPVTDERKIPLYQFNFIKQNASISLDLTKAEIRSLILFFSNFASNSTIYSFMFRTKYQYKIVDKYVDSVNKSNLLLESILRRLDNRDTEPQVVYHQDDTLDVHPEIDFTDLSKDVNNVELSKPVATKPSSVKKEDEIINIDELGDEEIGQTKQKMVEYVESTTGVKVDKSDGFESIDINRLFLKEEDGEVVEPLMGISRIDDNVLDACKKYFLEFDQKLNGVINHLAKKHKIDRRLKNRSIVYNIAKKGILEPKILPTLLVNRFALCTPASSLIYTASLFAAAYEYSEKHPNEDIITVAYKALQLSSVDGQDLFANNEELRNYGKDYMQCLTHTLLGTNNTLGIGGIRTIDQYLTLNHSNQDSVYFNFCYFDRTAIRALDPTGNTRINNLVLALVDIYFLLWYGENKYVKDVKLANTTGYMMDVVNKPMYELARALIINIINITDTKQTMLKGAIDFEGMVKYSNWDYEVFKEAFIELLSFKQVSYERYHYEEELPLGSTFKDEVKVGLPCFNYSQIISG